MKTWRNEQVAWAAGFIDGDGTISVVNTKRNGVTYGKRHFRVVGYENHPEVLQRLADVFGGNVHGPYQRPGNRQLQYQWQLHGALAVAAVKAMMIYFAPARLAQAERALVLYEDAPGPTAIGRPVRPYRRAA